MELILKNPYRITGLLVGATAREQERQIKRIKHYIEVVQEPEDDFSFKVLGKLQRTIDTVTDAASKLNLDSDKMIAALFWFYNGNAVTDEPAFEALKKRDPQGSANIWIKLIQGCKVDQHNSSAFNNMSNLLLCNSMHGSTIDEKRFEQSILLKLKFLESDFTDDIKNKATDKTYKIGKKELQLMFLNQIVLESNRLNLFQNNPNKIFNILKNKKFLAKDEFLDTNSKKSIQNIENKIEIAKNKRESNKKDALSIGNNLFELACKQLAELKTVFMVSDAVHSSIADKVSNEILQCGIDYFSYYKNSSTDPGSATKDLLKKAETLAIGNIAKQRCNENIEGFLSWINEKRDNEKIQELEFNINKATELIEKYSDQPNKTVENAEELLTSTEPYLNKMRLILGVRSELYLGICTRIASGAQAMCAPYIFHYIQGMQAHSGVMASTLIDHLEMAMNVMSRINRMDLTHDYNERFDFNKDMDYLSKVAVQLKSMCVSI